jgi:hypothetical protein
MNRLAHCHNLGQLVGACHLVAHLECCPHAVYVGIMMIAYVSVWNDGIDKFGLLARYPQNADFRVKPCRRASSLKAAKRVA